MGGVKLEFRIQELEKRLKRNQGFIGWYIFLVEEPLCGTKFKMVGQ